MSNIRYRVCIFETGDHGVNIVKKKWLSTLILTVILCGGGNMILPPWAQAGEEMTVQQSVIQTLKRHPRLKMLKANRMAVGYDYKKARGGIYPSLDLTGGTGYDVYSDSSTRLSNDDEDWDHRTEAGAVLTQLLYDGGETFRQMDIDRSRMRSLDSRVFDNAESLALDAIIASLDVYRQRRLMELGEKSVSVHQRILESLREREAAGAGSSADVRQTEARLARTQASLATTRGDLRVALSAYRRLVGDEPGKILFPAVPASALPPTHEILLEWAQKGNPKLQTAESDISTAHQRYALTKTAYHPKVRLELSSGYTDRVEGDQSWTQSSAAMVRVNWNLFNGGSDKAAEEAARYRELEAAEDRNDTLLTVIDETQSTWDTYESAIEQRTLFAESVAYTNETRDMYMQQFVVGQRTLLDVLDVENEFYQYSGQLVTAETNERIAAFRMLALSGKLLRTLNVDSRLYKDLLFEERAE